MSSKVFDGSFPATPCGATPYGLKSRTPRFATEDGVGTKGSWLGSGPLHPKPNSNSNGWPATSSACATSGVLIAKFSRQSKPRG